MQQQCLGSYIITPTNKTYERKLLDIPVNVKPKAKKKSKRKGKSPDYYTNVPDDDECIISPIDEDYYPLTMWEEIYLT